MSGTYLNLKPANRLRTSPPYFFHQLNEKIYRLQTTGVDVIRLDMGSPDLPPPPFIVDALIQIVSKPNLHGYAPYGGTQLYREAAASYYENRFSVQLDPQKEIIGLIGSKEGIFNLVQAVVNPKDWVLVPDPGYPVYQTSAMIAGARIYPIPLLERNRYLPDLECIPKEVIRNTRMLWINYPNNPTGAVAEISDFKYLVNFAQVNRLIIAHDAPYMDVAYDGYQPHSILQVDGAMNVAIEFNSLSKTYNMAGWRLGMAAGNPDLISYLGLYKTLVDSSSFIPLLSAGATALSSEQRWLQGRNKIYQERRNLIVDRLINLGFSPKIPKAGLYVWAELPEGFSESIKFCEEILYKTGVSITPGVAFGEYGEGYVRISLCNSQDKIEEAFTRMGKYLS
jgi:LL-diaminopimelate aminotransferase